MSEAQWKKETVEAGSQTPQAEPALGGVPAPAQSEASSVRWVALRSLRAETEINAISRALEECGWNRKHAAKLLSISYRGLLYKIRQYNITPTGRYDLSQVSRPQV